MFREMLEAMEQGVIVWDKTARCAYRNERVFTILELPGDALKIGMARSVYYANAYDAREFGPEQREEIERRVRAGQPFSIDRRLRSGRIVLAATRPLSDGGCVVTFTDVTAERKAAEELAAARKAAEEARQHAKLSLEAERKRQVQTQMLSLLGEWLQSCKSLDEVYMVAVAHLAKLLPGTSGELYIYSNSRDVLDGVCAWGETKALDHMHPDDCWSLRRGRSYAYGRGDVEFVCAHVMEQQRSTDEKGYFCIPIIAHGDTAGLLHVKVERGCIDATAQDGSSLMETRMLAIQSAEQISLAVANVKLRDQLRDQSIRDALTGLYNRRYFLECLRCAMSRAGKHEKPLSVISFDADRFKRFNDNHGHDAGDTVLRSLGELLRKMFDGDEVICRLGGEEFAVLLPDVALETACGRAEDLRAATEAMSIRYGDRNLPRLTLSLGVATFPGGGANPSELLATADAALYRAKAAGRNRVCS